MKKSITKRWRVLISNAETETVLHELIELFSDPEVIILHNRWKELKKQKNLNTISEADANVKTNEITQATLAIVDSLERNKTTIEKAGNDRNTYFKIIGLVMILAVFFLGIGYFIWGQKTDDEVLSRSILENPEAAAEYQGTGRELTSFDLKIDTFANVAGRKLWNCCAVWPGKDPNTAINDVSLDDNQGKYIINITVSWEGRFSNSTYSITGNLIVDYDGNSPQWSLIREDGLLLLKSCLNCNLGETVRY
ncbi:MAG: hypothetical protein AAFN81_20280 [Bacteroidota bacterium]